MVTRSSSERIFANEALETPRPDSPDSMSKSFGLANCKVSSLPAQNSQSHKCLTSVVRGWDMRFPLALPQIDKLAPSDLALLVPERASETIPCLPFHCFQPKLNISIQLRRTGGSSQELGRHYLLLGPCLFKN